MARTSPGGSGPVAAGSAEYAPGSSSDGADKGGAAVRRGGPAEPVPEWVLVRAAEQLQVLGQAARLQLVEELTPGARSPQELAAELQLSQQNVSKHLQVLYATGVVRRRRMGTRVLYELADEAIVEIIERLTARVARQMRELSLIVESER
jgi:DNA-binding transcriptional ArsR family regulator